MGNSESVLPPTTKTFVLSTKKTGSIAPNYTTEGITHNTQLLYGILFASQPYGVAQSSSASMSKHHRREEVTYHGPAFSKQYGSRESLKYSSVESVQSSQSSLHGPLAGRAFQGSRSTGQGPLVSRKQITTQDCLSHRSSQSPHCHKSHSGLIAQYMEEAPQTVNTRRRGRQGQLGVPPAGVLHKSAPTSPAVQRRLDSSTLIAHHSPTVPRKQRTHPPQGRLMSPSSDSESEQGPDKGFLLRRFLEPQGEGQLPERSQSASPSPYSARPGSPFYEAAMGERGGPVREDSDPSAPRGRLPRDTSPFKPISAPGPMTVRRSPCQSPGQRRRRIQDAVVLEKDRQSHDGETYEGPQQFADRSVGPEVTCKNDDQKPRGRGRRDPLAHQLSGSSTSSLEVETLMERPRPIPIAAPGSLYSTKGVVAVATVRPCPSPTNFGVTRLLAQDNVDYTKPSKEKAKVTLEMPAGGLTVEPIPSPCPSPIIFRDVLEEQGPSQERRSRSKSPRAQLSPVGLQPNSSKPQPIPGSRALPSIQVLGSSPEGSELKHSPESAFREPVRDQASLEVARERRRERRSQSPMQKEGSGVQSPQFPSISVSPGPATEPAPGAVGGASVFPVSSAVESADIIPASVESRIQHMKVACLGVLRMWRWQFHVAGDELKIAP